VTRVQRVDGVFYCSFLFLVKKKRTKEKNSPNEASTRSEKNKNIQKSSPPIGGNVNAFFDILSFFHSQPKLARRLDMPSLPPAGFLRNNEKVRKGEGFNPPKGGQVLIWREFGKMELGSDYSE